MKIQHIVAISAVALSVPFTSCSNFSPTNTYKENQIGVAQEAVEGTVVDVSRVNITANSNSTGTALGAVMCGLTGGILGGGKASLATAAGGVAVGALAGNQLSKAVNNTDGLRITVRIDRSKKTIVVVQELDKRNPIQVGQRVQVLMGGSSSRVIPIY
jgi:outer membrane lipoprotein SlyB